MNQPSTTRELQLLKEVSSVGIPASFFKSQNLKNLLGDIVATGKEVEEQSRTLGQLRQEKADGNFLGNWLKNRGEKVEDANLALSMTVGKLTQQSAGLLVLNTAVSKVLHEQQEQLLHQQMQLAQQADSLRAQNETILHQQELLEHHQHEINEANRGLLEAKGITQEQAQQLVGCVTRVIQAEATLEEKLGSTLLAVDSRLVDAAATVAQSLAESKAALDAQHSEFEARVADEQRRALQASASALAQVEESIERQDGQHRALAAQLDTWIGEVAGRLDVLSDRLSQLSIYFERHQTATREQFDAFNSAMNAEKTSAEDVAQRYDGLIKALGTRLEEAERLSARSRLAVVVLGVILTVSIGWQSYTALFT